MFTLEKIESKGDMSFKERLIIKGFKSSEAMNVYLCGPDNYNNKWKESTRGFKPGKYAYAGGQWHNVKSLDPSILAHI